VKRLFDTLVVALIIAIIVGGVWFVGGAKTTYALGSRNVEFIFLVTDSQTEEPIPGATIRIRTEEHDASSKKFKLVTNDDGRARMLREDEQVEDVIRTFRKTVSLVNTTWCVFSISAKSYRPLENQWLAERRYEDLGFFSDERVQRIEFRIPLERQ
jgi:hypothetical protein